MPVFKERTDIKKNVIQEKLEIINPLRLPKISSGISYETNSLENTILAVSKHYQMVAYVYGEI